MFIEINKPKNAIDVEIWLKNQRESNGGFLSPEIIKEALSFTNNFANIKFMLKEINRFKTKEEKLPFKDVIFSMITNRECSEGSIELMKKIAEECGFEDEFEKHKIYCNTMLKKGGSVYHKRYPRILRVATEKELVHETFNWWDQEIQDVLICEEPGEITVCADTQIFGDKLPSVCIFPNAEKVELHRLNGIKQLKLKEGCVLSFNEMSVPKDVEYEKCSSCFFRKCNFVGVSDLKFNEGADVNFYGCNLTPFRLDLSKCKSVRINGSNFSSTKRIVFKDSVTKQMFKTNNVYSPECDILTRDEFNMMEQMQKGLVL